MTATYVDSSVRSGKNSLRDGRDRRLSRVAGPSSLVLFGVTGDLARKKLMPAVYDLANRGLLPPSFALVGFARRSWDDLAFAAEVKASVQAYARTPFEESVWEQLAEGIRFVRGEFDDDDAFGCRAGMAAVTPATTDRLFDGLVQVSVLQHDEGIATAEFQRGLLQVLARALGNDRPGGFAACQGDGPDTLVVDDLSDLVFRDEQVGIRPGWRACLFK